MTWGHWGLKPVSRCSKPHTFSTFSGEEKEKKIVHSFFSTRPNKVLRVKIQMVDIKVCFLLCFNSISF